MALATSQHLTKTQAPQKAMMGGTGIIAGVESMLEDFLLSVEGLPNELKRALALIRELDGEVDAMQRKAAKLEENIVRKADAFVQHRRKRRRTRGSGGSGESGGGEEEEADDAPKTALDKAIRAIADHSDPEVQELLRCYEVSQANADEKVQISYQVLDLIQNNLEHLTGYIGQANVAIDASASMKYASGSIVAMQIFDKDSAEPTYILGHIINYDPKLEQWVVADSDNHETHHYGTADQITELPEMSFNELPKYRKGDMVMALYPNTTTFYPATILQPPRRGSGNKEDWVVVHFQDDYDENGQPLNLHVEARYVFRSLQQLTLP